MIFSLLLEVWFRIHHEVYLEKHLALLPLQTKPPFSLRVAATLTEFDMSATKERVGFLLVYESSLIIVHEEQLRLLYCIKFLACKTKMQLKPV